MAWIGPDEPEEGEYEPDRGDATTTGHKYVPRDMHKKVIRPHHNLKTLASNSRFNRAPRFEGAGEEAAEAARQLRRVVCLELNRLGVGAT
eukprot:7547053-Pyramimonas_sp.AAC.1